MSFARKAKKRKRERVSSHLLVFSTLLIVDCPSTVYIYLIHGTRRNTWYSSLQLQLDGLDNKISCHFNTSPSSLIFLFSCETLQRLFPRFSLFPPMRTQLELDLVNFLVDLDNSLRTRQTLRNSIFKKELRVYLLLIFSFGL